jgi:hypothetical protein
LKTIYIDKLTGFKTSDKNIKVFYKNGMPFYLKPNEKGKEVKFNLLSGIYNTDNNLIKLNLPVKYQLPVLPKIERKIELPNTINVSYGENPNKCSVWLKQGQVLLDNSFKKYPQFVRLFILYHEAGHYFYKTESKCDKFASHYMLKLGYNPSQIVLANKTTITSEFRKKECFNYNQKVKRK